MICKTFCATTIGLEAMTVTVEIDCSQGVGIHIVGLPDSAVRESLLRVSTALDSCGYRIPGKRIIINMAPADIRKEGSGYDLAIAIGILCASGQALLSRKEEFIVMGELALNGELRPVNGSLPVALHARDAAFSGCILPAASAMEASDVGEIEIYGARNLLDVLRILEGAENCDDLRCKPPERIEKAVTDSLHDFKFVKGQPFARRALEIAAAGGHNLIMIGPPGSGKSMMASCLPSILPPMTREESLETTKIYSVAGHSLCQGGLLRERPFRAPHHSASVTSLIGGGPSATPGEISLAHNGVLYLDELAEFPSSLLDNLRQPVEDGKVTISRLRYRITYPSSFMLVASMNPCPCGYWGDGDRCKCTPGMRMRYMSRISGPLMDRFDLHVQVSAVETGNLVCRTESESSGRIAARVAAARAIQAERFRDEGIFTNAQMTASLIGKHCRTDESSESFLRTAIDKLHLSARAYGRILKLSRTIADLEGNKLITLEHISEAIQFRNLDRQNLYE